MKTNPWSLPKAREIRHLLLRLGAQSELPCDVQTDDGGDPRIVTLRHEELESLRAHVYLHGQQPGTYGIFFEYPHPVPGIVESEENLSLPQALDSLSLHFDA